MKRQLLQIERLNHIERRRNEQIENYVSSDTLIMAHSRLWYKNILELKSYNMVQIFLGSPRPDAT